jgi:hypothetical protein
MTTPDAIFKVNMYALPLLECSGGATNNFKRIANLAHAFCQGLERDRFRDARAAIAG